MRQLIAGNWKMNGTAAALGEIEAIAEAAASGHSAGDLLICPPSTLLSRAASVAGARLNLGGQDCHAETHGAFTGDLSAEMLKDAGACAVIVGHSERRHVHDETDAQVLAKASAAHRAGLLAIICVGESESEREAGRAFDIVASQLAGSVPADASAGNTAIAYEPVWAIGSGKTPSLAEIAAMHAHIRGQLAANLGGAAAGLRILYGGSVKPGNAGEILATTDVDGALVGGASLKAADFLQIAAAVTTSR